MSIKIIAPKSFMIKYLFRVMSCIFVNISCTNFKKIRHIFPFIFSNLSQSDIQCFCSISSSQALALCIHISVFLPFSRFFQFNMGQRNSVKISCTFRHSSTSNYGQIAFYMPLIEVEIFILQRGCQIKWLIQPGLAEKSFKFMSHRMIPISLFSLNRATKVG